MSDLDKRMAILEAYSDLERTLSPDEFLRISTELNENINSIKKLAANDIRYQLARKFAQEDLSVFIDDIAELTTDEEINLLILAYKKANSSPEEMEDLLKLLQQRRVSCDL